ncbi:hypothetical protein ACN4EG_12440 [Alkalinema pantanalense CENA528]|uniref:hypothetical protein n=1 Tax=Alkalinema pantanalense TaxID=1620705 RepID=UPI003D6E6646
MQSLRHRAHNLINGLTADQLTVMWDVMKTHYYDLYMLSAIETAKETLQPGDMLTREEAIVLLTQPIEVPESR